MIKREIKTDERNIRGKKTEQCRRRAMSRVSMRRLSNRFIDGQHWAGQLEWHGSLRERGFPKHRGSRAVMPALIKGVRESADGHSISDPSSRARNPRRPASESPRFINLGWEAGRQAVGALRFAPLSAAQSLGVRLAGSSRRPTVGFFLSRFLADGEYSLAAVCGGKENYYWFPFDRSIVNGRN